MSDGNTETPGDKAARQELCSSLAQAAATAGQQLENALQLVLATTARLRDNISKLLTNTADRGICRGCGAQIFWLRHKNGRATPYTAEGANHFIDCAARDEFKRKPR